VIDDCRNDGLRQPSVELGFSEAESEARVRVRGQSQSQWGFALCTLDFWFYTWDF